MHLLLVARYVRGLAALAGLGLLLSGCTSAHYRRSADKEVYGIIQDMEKRIFGATNAFSIDTAYSKRDHRSIQPAEIIKDRTSTNCRVINLDQALDLAVQHSPDYQSQKEQLYLSALTLTGARYEFSPQFFAESTPQIAGMPSGSTIGSVNSQVGVSQLLKTGGRLSVALANDLVRYFIGKPADVSRNSAINTLSVDLTQPLLRGFGINDPNVENLTQDTRNVVYAIRAYSFYQQQFAVDTVVAYFALLTQKEVIRNNFQDYTNRVETTRYLGARAIDRERRNSVDDTRTAELSSRRNYINSLANYLTALDSFKIRLGLPVSEDLYLDDRELTELIKAGLTPVDVDAKAAFRICVEKQMEILTAIDKFEDSKRKVRIAADQLRADLNLFANATLASEGPYDYANFDPQKVHYTAGVTLNLPVDRLVQRNNYRASLVSFESQLRSLASTLDSYKNRIDRSVRTIEQARLDNLNSLESLRVAERRVENNAMLLAAGRVNVLFLREAQDGLIQAQNDLAITYTAYLTARLNLLLNLGIIDTRPDKFWLLDPLPGRLSPDQRSAPPLRMPDDQVIAPERFLDPPS